MLIEQNGFIIQNVYSSWEKDSLQKDKFFFNLTVAQVGIHNITNNLGE